MAANFKQTSIEYSASETNSGCFFIFCRIRDMTQEQILTDNNMFTLKVKFFL